MQLKRAIVRIPGGMMTVPLLAGAALTTFAPHAAPFFGSFTNALRNGALPISAVFDGGLCMALREQYGTTEESAAYSVMSLASGNAAAVPTLVAAANPSYAPAAASSTVLVAASVIISSLLVPPLTAFWKSRARRKMDSQPHLNSEGAIHGKNPHSR